MNSSTFFCAETCLLDFSFTDGVVVGALAVVLRISRCAGVVPLSFTATEAGWRVNVSPPLAVFQRILMTVINLLVLAALILDYHEEPERRIRVSISAVTTFVWVTDLLLVNTIASLAVYRGPGRMKKLIRLLNQLQKVSQSLPYYLAEKLTRAKILREINIDLNNDSCVRTEKIGITAVTSMLIFVIVIQVTNMYVLIQQLHDNGYNWTIMVMYSPHHVAHILRLLVLLQWAFVGLAVYGAAATINKRLQRLRDVKLNDEETAVLEVYLNPPKPLVDCFTERHNETNHTGSEFVAYPSQVQSTIRRLASSYGKIGELIRLMNDDNGMMIIANLMAGFLHLVITQYYMLLSLNSGERLLNAVLVPACWSVLHIAMLLLTVEPCHWTQGERVTTKFLLSRLIIRLAPKSKLLARELEQFAKQTMLANVKFIPLGVLTLGRPLVASMFGGVATYLVILMQFYALTDK